MHGQHGVSFLLCSLSLCCLSNSIHNQIGLSNLFCSCSKMQILFHPYFCMSYIYNTLIFYRMELWPGYVTAVQHYDGGLLLMLDVSHRLIRTDTALDFLLVNTSYTTHSCQFCILSMYVVCWLVSSMLLTSASIYTIDTAGFVKVPNWV